ncbi:MAG TPA: FAD-dependent monooxygenase, partial [Steroidobacteraceae bacterium]
WSLDLGEAQVVRECAEAEFNARLDAASAQALGATRVVSERLSFPLRSVAAHAYVTARVALIGDAAHVIHPLAGQGANLGLLDAAALCEAIAAAPALREDPGAMRVLRCYEQQRRTHNLAMDAAMSVFESGFAAARGPGAWLVNRGLTLVNRSGALKRAFARQALGTVGELPRLARR